MNSVCQTGRSWCVSTSKKSEAEQIALPFLSITEENIYDLE